MKGLMVMVVIWMLSGMSACASGSGASEPVGPAGETEGQTASVDPVAVDTEASTPIGPWTLIYADGSGNSFKFWRAADSEVVHFETTPVTPELSSSGVYSGGEARSGELTAVGVADLWKQVTTLEANTEVRAEKREMGTGQFKVTTAVGERAFLVRRGVAVTAFDTFVAGLVAP